MPRAASTMSAFGSVAKGAAQYESGQYNAQVARNNQSIANNNAQWAVDRGNVEEGISRERTAQMIGSERAGYGANGVDVNTGSASRVQSDTARIGAMDAQTIAQNAQRSAWGYRAQGGSFGAQAQLDQMEGDQAGMASLVGGVSNFASKWDIFKNAGAIPNGAGVGPDGWLSNPQGGL